MLTGYLSVVFNPKGPHYTALKQTIQRQYEDSWYWEDAAVMERNMRNFVFRVQRRNERMPKHFATSAVHTLVVISLP
jgi:cystathionine beta-lyase/cystathionine gamma-synthase